MSSSARDPEAIVPLTAAVFHILLSLGDGERHGYSIMRDISAFTISRLNQTLTQQFEAWRERPISFLWRNFPLPT